LTDILQQLNILRSQGASNPTAKYSISWTESGKTTTQTMTGSQLSSWASSKYKDVFFQQKAERLSAQQQQTQTSTVYTPQPDPWQSIAQPGSQVYQQTQPKPHIVVGPTGQLSYGYMTPQGPVSASPEVVAQKTGYSVNELRTMARQIETQEQIKAKAPPSKAPDLSQTMELPKSKLINEHVLYAQLSKGEQAGVMQMTKAGVSKQNQIEPTNELTGPRYKNDFSLSGQIYRAGGRFPAGSIAVIEGWLAPALTPFISPLSKELSGFDYNFDPGATFRADPEYKAGEVVGLMAWVLGPSTFKLTKYGAESVSLVSSVEKVEQSTRKDFIPSKLYADENILIAEGKTAFKQSQKVKIASAIETRTTGPTGLGYTYKPSGGYFTGELVQMANPIDEAMVLHNVKIPQIPGEKIYSVENALSFTYDVAGEVNAISKVSGFATESKGYLAGEKIFATSEGWGVQKVSSESLAVAEKSGSRFSIGRQTQYGDSTLYGVEKSYYGSVSTPYKPKAFINLAEGKTRPITEGVSMDKFVKDMQSKIYVKDLKENIEVLDRFSETLTIQENPAVIDTVKKLSEGLNVAEQTTKTKPYIRTGTMANEVLTLATPKTESVKLIPGAGYEVPTMTESITPAFGNLGVSGFNINFAQKINQNSVSRGINQLGNRGVNIKESIDQRQGPGIKDKLEIGTINILGNEELQISKNIQGLKNKQDQKQVSGIKQLTATKTDFFGPPGPQVPRVPIIPSATLPRFKGGFSFKVPKFNVPKVRSRGNINPLADILSLTRTEAKFLKRGRHPKPTKAIKKLFGKKLKKESFMLEFPTKEILEGKL